MQTYTREEQCRLWLQSAPSLSWRTREALLTYFGCAESIFEQMGPTVQMMAGDKAYAELQQMKTAGLDALIDRLHRCGSPAVADDQHLFSIHAHTVFSDHILETGVICVVAI